MRSRAHTVLVDVHEEVANQHAMRFVVEELRGGSGLGRPLQHLVVGLLLSLRASAFDVSGRGQG